MGRSKGWVGVDLDGTLAYYHGWKGPGHVGDPILSMVEKVKQWIAEGQFDVKIFTARVSERDAEELAIVTHAIEEWCLLHIGVILPITCTKDYAMVELWDDRAVQVISNQGRTLLEENALLFTKLSGLQGAIQRWWVNGDNEALFEYYQKLRLPT